VKRAAVLVFVLALAAAGVIASSGAGGKEESGTYKIVFDNAFGVVKGADFKVGGVAVGSIADLDVNREDARALITVSVKDKGFGSLRSDAECSIQPQSLIGEYFVDCQPGKTGEVLKAGDTIPVDQTESPIPADLVGNVMRKPYRERFSIILGELGAGLAARGDDLNETIRRAIPALNETDRVLKILANNRRTLQQLTRDSGAVMRVLGRRREDVGRFVVEARNTAQATAERRRELRATFQRFPGFLDQLEPTMQDLGTASGRLAPTFADLRAAAPSVTDLLRTLNPFTRALDPALTSLGTAGVSGRRAAKEASSLVSLLGELGKDSPEMSKNLALVLGDVDDRSRAIAPDPDSPEGKGYTGLEALLTYVFDQSQALNIFDQRGYILKLDALINECSDYTDAQEAKSNPERTKRCTQALGPNQPGVTTPDPTATSAPTRSASRKRRTRAKDRGGDAGDRAPSSGDGGGSQDDSGAKNQLPKVDVPKIPGLPDLPDLLDQLPDVQVPQTPSTPSAPSTSDLLDFLLAP
jgi:virulence factor Mce-like protein